MPSVLRAIRDRRFALGLRCPRCGSVKVIRWGGFTHRLRYRCKACRRTFSDLTLTPAAYSKRITAWPLYAVAMDSGATVRRAAALIGVFPSTSFRWRHAILKDRRAHDPTTLAGVVELAEVRFAYSQKGARKLGGPPRHRGLTPHERHSYPHRLVTFARDRRDSSITCVNPGNFPDFDALLEAIGSRFRHVRVLVSPRGHLSAYGRLAADAGAAFERAPVCWDPELHRDNATNQLRRCCAWLRRFRGIATRYLPNYLVWHRTIDEATTRFLAWPVAACTNNSREQSLSRHSPAGVPRPVAPPGPTHIADRLSVAGRPP